MAGMNVVTAKNLRFGTMEGCQLSSKERVNKSQFKKKDHALIQLHMD